MHDSHAHPCAQRPEQSREDGGGRLHEQLNEPMNSQEGQGSPCRPPSPAEAAAPSSLLFGTFPSFCPQLPEADNVCLMSLQPLTGPVVPPVPCPPPPQALSSQVALPTLFPHCVALLALSSLRPQWNAVGPVPHPRVPCLSQTVLYFLPNRSDTSSLDQDCHCHQDRHTAGAWSIGTSVLHYQGLHVVSARSMKTSVQYHQGLRTVGAP